jgi:hypothetical protein
VRPNSVHGAFDIEASKTMTIRRLPLMDYGENSSTKVLRHFFGVQSIINLAPARADGSVGRDYPPEIAGQPLKQAD